MSKPLTIATEILRRCDVLAGFTETEGQVTRTFLCSAMHEVHATVAQWMREAGMSVRTDAVGNLIGRYSGQTPNAPVLVIGSHLDTVPNAGKYDGILGVLLGLAAVEALDGERLPFAIEVIGFSEEEGVRFATPYLGSFAVIGSLTSEHLALRDSQGVSVTEAISQFALNVNDLPNAVYRRENVLGYLEAHIEQGPVLESLDASVGIVTAIAGQSRLRLAFSGRAGHAGTTPMSLRHDALVGAAEWILFVETYAQSISGLVATVGMVTLEPNASNVIPGTALLSLDVRHAADAIRDKAISDLLAHASEIATRRSLTFEIKSVTHHHAVAMDAELSRGLEAACVSIGQPIHTMVSGAGHDAAVMADLTRTAMLFLRSPGGLSHHPDESVFPEDVEIALQVMVSFLRGLA